MQKRKLIAVAAAAAMLVSTTEASHAIYCPPHHLSTSGGSMAAPWIVIGCAGGIILAAFAANYRDNRELTAPEAWSCGLLFLASKPGKKKHHHG